MRDCRLGMHPSDAIILLACHADIFKAGLKLLVYVCIAAAAILYFITEEYYNKYIKIAMQPISLEKGY